MTINGTPFEPNTDRLQRTRMFAIGSSLVVAFALMLVKFYAYRITHSAAILSDALESIINVVASAFAMFSIYLAAKPPDTDHPYGHGKIEFFSAGFEGALIVIAAVGIFLTGVSHILKPHEIPQLETGLFLLLATSIVNLALGLLLLRIGRQTDSITLRADGKHVLTDVTTTAGVLAGLVCVYYTGWKWLDGVIACLVGIHILLTGTRLVRQSFQGLMDAAVPELLESVSNLIIQRRRECWVDIHQLRAWQSGNHVHIDLHLVLPREFPLDKAHQEAKDLEALIIEHFNGNASALIHTDPCIDPDCPVCGQPLCQNRHQPMTGHGEWTIDSMTAYKGSGPFVEHK